MTTNTEDSEESTQNVTPIKKVFTNPTQMIMIEMFVKLNSKHIEFCSKEIQKEMYGILSDSLNKIGPPTRTTSMWRKKYKEKLRKINPNVKLLKNYLQRKLSPSKSKIVNAKLTKLKQNNFKMSHRIQKLQNLNSHQKNLIKRLKHDQLTLTAENKEFNEKTQNLEDTLQKYNEIVKQLQDDIQKSGQIQNENIKKLEDEIQSGKEIVKILQDDLQKLSAPENGKNTLKLHEMVRIHPKQPTYPAVGEIKNEKTTEKKFENSFDPVEMELLEMHSSSTRSHKLRLPNTGMQPDSIAYEDLTITSDEDE